MEFGLPRVRVSNKEKYENNGVLTFLPTGEKLGRKVSFNKKAIEELELNHDTSQISFSFSGNDVYIVNTTGCETCTGLKVGKVSKSFADKKHYEYIKTKMFNIPLEEEFELFLEPTENMYDGRKVFKLVKNIVVAETVEKEKEEIAEEFNSSPETEIETIAVNSDVQ